MEYGGISGSVLDDCRFTRSAQLRRRGLGGRWCTAHEPSATRARTHGHDSKSPAVVRVRRNWPDPAGRAELPLPGCWPRT